MPFTFNANKVDINGGEFVDVAGDMNKQDHSTHVHHENSHNTASTTTTDSYNSSSSRETAGQVFVDGRQVTLNNDTQNGDAFADPSLHSPQTTAEDTLTPNPEGLLEDTPPEPLLLRETSESQPSVLFAPRWKTNNPFSPAFEKQELKPLPRAESANGPASCSRQAGPAYDGLGSDKMAVDQR